MYRAKLIRSLFWIKFTKYLTEDIILENVDEWTIEYKSGECYSWCKRGQQSEFRALPYQGSTSLIFWILSNGYYFWTITKNYINGNIFVQFLNTLRFGITKKNQLVWKEWFFYKIIAHLIDHSTQSSLWRNHK